MGKNKTRQIVEHGSRVQIGITNLEALVSNINIFTSEIGNTLDDDLSLYQGTEKATPNAFQI